MHWCSTHAYGTPLFFLFKPHKACDNFTLSPLDEDKTSIALNFMEDERCFYNVDAAFEEYPLCTMSKVVSCEPLSTGFPTASPTNYPTPTCPLDGGFDLVCKTYVNKVELEILTHFQGTSTYALCQACASSEVSHLHSFNLSYRTSYSLPTFSSCVACN